MYADNQIAKQQAKYSHVDQVKTSGEDRRIAELPASIDNMERGINFATDSLNELASRLEGLVRPPAPEPVGIGQQIQAAPPASGYASTIHEQAARVTRLGERIQDLLRRLEV